MDGTKSLFLIQSIYFKTSILLVSPEEQKLKEEDQKEPSNKEGLFRIYTQGIASNPINNTQSGRKNEIRWKIMDRSGLAVSLLMKRPHEEPKNNNQSVEDLHLLLCYEEAQRPSSQ